MLDELKEEAIVNNIDWELTGGLGLRRRFSAILGFISHGGQTPSLRNRMERAEERADGNRRFVFYEAVERGGGSISKVGRCHWSANLRSMVRPDV
jgi:hypothetical protein